MSVSDVFCQCYSKLIETQHLNKVLFVLIYLFPPSGIKSTSELTDNISTSITKLGYTLYWVPNTNRISEFR